MCVKIILITLIMLLLVGNVIFEKSSSKPALIAVRFDYVSATFVLTSDEPRSIILIDDLSTNHQLRNKRSSQNHWIEGEGIEANNTFLKMHALVVKESDIPDCGVPATKNTNARYFMCSGVALSSRYVLTSASCMNFADIFRSYLLGDLAVLVGALAENNYVIKIAKYSIHPRFIPNPDSANYARNNVAVLTLSCSIQQGAVVYPTLPKQLYDDVSHICCPADNCKLLTIVGNSKNYHTVRSMPMKHIPPAVHKEEALQSNGKMTERKYRNDKVKTSGMRDRKARVPDKASAPSFAEDSSDKSEHVNLEEKSTLDEFPTPINKSFVEPDLSFGMSKDETEDNTEKSDVEKGEVENRADDKDSDGNLNDQPIEQSIEAPEEIVLMKNEKCPPLGAPVVNDNTLIALIAYTCDDTQPWVEWKYVNVARNLRWIKMQMKKAN